MNKSTPSPAELRRRKQNEAHFAFLRRQVNDPQTVANYVKFIDNPTGK